MGLLLSKSSAQFIILDCLFARRAENPLVDYLWAIDRASAFKIPRAKYNK